MKKDRDLSNQICGALGCSAPATKSIVFSVGFSAYFCERCAIELVNNCRGMMKKNPVGWEDKRSEKIVNGISTG
jgi:hypothetical protein